MVLESLIFYLDPNFMKYFKQIYYYIQEYSFFTERIVSHMLM